MRLRRINQPASFSSAHDAGKRASSTIMSKPATFHLLLVHAGLPGPDWWRSSSFRKAFSAFCAAGLHDANPVSYAKDLSHCAMNDQSAEASGHRCPGSIKQVPHL